MYRAHVVYSNHMQEIRMCWVCEVCEWAWLKSGEEPPTNCASNKCRSRKWNKGGGAVAAPEGRKAAGENKNRTAKGVGDARGSSKERTGNSGRTSDSGGGPNRVRVAGMPSGLETGTTVRQDDSGAGGQVDTLPTTTGSGIQAVAGCPKHGPDCGWPKGGGWWCAKDGKVL